MILKGALLQRPVPARSVRALTHINVNTTALFEIDKVEIEGRCDGEEKIRGLKMYRHDRVQNAGGDSP